MIFGLHLGENVDARRISLAVIRVILPSVDLSQVVSARPLLPKKPTGVASMDPGSSSQADVTAAAGRPSSLVVTLVSDELAHNVVLAKIKHRKLHSSALSEELALASGAILPLRSSLISINGFLPSDIYNLRRAVKDAAKKKGFSTFVHDGDIFIRRRK